MGGCMQSKNATAPVPADDFSSEKIKNKGFSFWKNRKDRRRKMIQVCFQNVNSLSLTCKCMEYFIIFLTFAGYNPSSFQN